MKIFVAGASGAIGKRLVPMLVAAGHDVVATTRSSRKLDALRAQGAEALVVDGLNREDVIKAVTSARPQAVVHQMTAVPPNLNLKRFDEDFALTNRLRTEGTSHLLAAARAAGARKLVAQSYTGWTNIRQGGRVKTEEDPLDPDPPAVMTRTRDALRELEGMVLDASDVEGTVLRYGNLYGPGTSLSGDAEIMELIRKRQFPIVGDGRGVWSFVHVDDAARATRLAIEHGAPGLYNIVDDDPAEVSVWLPETARILGAKPPFRLPSWIGRFVIGEAGVSMMTQARGASNAKAKRALGWQPEFASWRDGFRRGLTEARST